MSDGVKKSDVLLTAAEILDRDGWCRYMYTNAVTGHHCAVGAIRAAGSELITDGGLCWVVHDTERQFARYLQVRFATSSIQLWNDEAKDKRQVKRELVKAARALAERGE